MTFARAWIAVLAIATTTPAVAADETPDFMKTPQWLGQQYVGASDWDKLETLVESLAASGERADDGRFQLYLLTFSLRNWLELWDEDQDAGFQQKFVEYRTEKPGSAFAPILEAMQVHATAWRARGRGFSSSVTPEGWALFRERNKAAWKMIRAAKASSSRLPTWYEQAIAIGMDAGAADEQVAALFMEGIERFPGYHPLYFSYARQFSPRWGGNYADADAFIRSQVAAKTNPEGEVLYARLYWLLDQNGGGDPDFFEDSLVSWPRMRAGFELLMQRFPKGARNQASLASFACRAGDSVTYTKWRATLDLGEFKDVAPEGVVLEVCDARFFKKV
jgi:hypothetical protein